MCVVCFILGVILMVFGISLTITQAAIVFVPAILLSIWIFVVAVKKIKKKCKPGKCEL